MKLMNHAGSVIGLAAVLSLGACENMNTSGNMANSGTAYPQSTSSNGAYSGYGVVQSIQLVRQSNGGIGGSTIGVGTIAGAVVGGIVGNQIGRGDGNTAATVIGAAGGAYAGHELEKRNQQQSDAYKFTIRMNDGSHQTLTQATNPDIRVGDRVRIENGVARRY
ncbi:MAG: glycine zipper 2TM domain-containing protein [Rhodoferax sp.]